jgi:hypothetical protein
MSDSPSRGKEPTYSVIDLTFSSEDKDSYLNIYCNGKRFLLYLFTDNFNKSPTSKERYLFFLKVAENYELDGFTVDDFQDWAVEPLLPLLRGVPPLDGNCKPTLQDFLYPETVVYTLRATENDTVVPVPYEDPAVMKNSPSFGAYISDELCSSFLSFHPSDIEICAKHAEDALSDMPRKVLLKNGATAYFKAFGFGDRQLIERELKNYKKIEEASLKEGLRISRLYGLVRHENGLVFGLLISCVDCGAMTLTSAVGDDNPPSLRRKWAEKIKFIVKRLHEAGIVWGDAKPENILVDFNEDAWITDFGGGYTEGWVAKDLAGTVEGDLEGLVKILDYIDNPPRDT